MDGSYIWHINANDIIDNNFELSFDKNNTPAATSKRNRSVLSDSMERRHLLRVIHEKNKNKKVKDSTYLTEIVQVDFTYLRKGKTKDQNKEYESRREEIYQKGFTINGKKYVRYKRTASSAREGKCFFIEKKYQKTMEKWALAGLSDKMKEVKRNLVSFESYQALTLSTIVDVVRIPAKAILVIPDAESTFSDFVYAVSGKGSLDCEKKKVEITNKIWDGEGLIDESCFAQTKKEKKGMMLLRNKFFKCCCFNTKLKEWLKNYATLGGLRAKKGFFTIAEKLEDIKLVCTYSSLKYLKFAEKGKELEQFLKWTSNDYFEEEFGIVKYDKRTPYFNGEMTRSSYSFLNTLALTHEDIESLYQDPIDYREKLKSDPNVFYFNLKQKHYSRKESKESSNKASFESFKYSIAISLMRHNKELFFHPLVKDLRKSVTDKWLKDYKQGRILIHGKYATVLSNPFEFLLALGDKDKLKEIGYKPTKLDAPKAILLDEEIYNKSFNDEECLTIIRYPHVTMGNLWITKNKEISELNDYFNLSDEIIVVNSIGRNIMQRLNGMDFDSDIALITNEKIIYERAKENYDNFLVPVNCASPVEEKEAGKILEDKGVNLSLADEKISNNLVGKVIMCATMLNSLYWETYNNKGSKEKLEDIYKDICKLAVVSNMEIDSAKRTYDCDTRKILKEFNQKYHHIVKYDDGKTSEWLGPRKPKMLIKEKKDDKKKERKQKKKLWEPMNIAIDYIPDYLSKNDLTGNKEKNVYLTDYICKPAKRPNGNDGEAMEKLFEISESILDKFNAEKRYSTDDGEKLSQMNDAFQRILDENEKEAFKQICNENRIYKAVEAIDELAGLKPKRGRCAKKALEKNETRAWIYLYYLLKKESGLLFKDLLQQSETPIGLKFQEEGEALATTLYGFSMALKYKKEDLEEEDTPGDYEEDSDPYSAEDDDEDMDDEGIEEKYLEYEDY